MPAELPRCLGEYWWSQSQPAQVNFIAVMQLPYRCSFAASFGRDMHRQSITLSLQQSPTGLGHLMFSDLEQHGNTEPLVTNDLFDLLMNATIAILRHHCERQVTLGGNVPSTFLTGSHCIPLDWEALGFQTFTGAVPNGRRILARVRNLKRRKLPSRAHLFPINLDREMLQWSAA